MSARYCEHPKADDTGAAYWEQVSPKSEYDVQVQPMHCRICKQSFGKEIEWKKVRSNPETMLEGA